MRYLFFLPFLLLGFLTTNCTSFYKLTLDEPAQIAALDSTTRVIAIINDVNPKNDPGRIVSQVIGAEQVGSTRRAAITAVDGAFNAVVVKGGRVVEFNNELMRSDDGTLNWNVMDSVSRIDSIDFFIVLKEIKTISPPGGTIIAAATRQPSQRLKGFLRVQFCTVSGDSIGEKEVEQVVNVDISRSGVDIPGDIVRKRQAYELLGYNLGFASSELLYPHRIQVNRMYYKGGSPSVKAARKYIESRNWDLAEVELLKNVDDGKARPRGKGLYNLAAVKEAQGDLDAAIAYAERSAEECFNLEAKGYLIKLKERRALLNL